jgi:hypothetical protein
MDFVCGSVVVERLEQKRWTLCAEHPPLLTACVCVACMNMPD